MPDVDGISASELTQRCAKCGYCLIGLPEPRCPECGHVIDRDVLNAAQAAVEHLVAHLLPSRLREYPRSFLRVLWMTWFHPGLIVMIPDARGFSTLALAYCLSCYGVAAILVGLSYLVPAEPNSLCFSIGFFAAAFVTEIAIALLIVAYVRRSIVSVRHPFRYCLTSTRFQSSWFMLAMIAWSLCLVSSIPEPPIVLAIVALTLPFWWYRLGILLWKSIGPRWAVLISAHFGILLIVVLAVVLSICVGIILVLKFGTGP